MSLTVSPMLNRKYLVPSTEAIGWIFIVFGKIWLGIEPTTSVLKPTLYHKVTLNRF